MINFDHGLNKSKIWLDGLPLSALKCFNFDRFNLLYPRNFQLKFVIISDRVFFILKNKNFHRSYYLNKIGFLEG